MKSKILILDQNRDSLGRMQSRLEHQGYSVIVSEAHEASEHLKNLIQDLAMLIVRFEQPDHDGIALSSSLIKQFPDLKVILIAKTLTKDDALRALRTGIYDCFEDPVDLDHLCQSADQYWKELKKFKEINHQHETVAIYDARLQQAKGGLDQRSSTVSKSRSMVAVQEVLAGLRRDVMKGELREPTIFLRAEGGAGQDEIARSIHMGSKRGRAPLLFVDCKAVSAEQLEVDLFGRELEAFDGARNSLAGIFELAKGGTLVLESVGSLHAKMQRKLLEVLQSKKYFRKHSGIANKIGLAELDFDVRLISCETLGRMPTLETQVQEGRFSQQLYALLSQIVIDVPGLRNRKEDIVPLATQSAEESMKKIGKTFSGLTSEAEQLLMEYSWPGNVSELRCVMERAAWLSESGAKIGSQALNLMGIQQPLNAAVARLGVSKLQLVPPLDHNPESENSSLSFTDLKRQWNDSFEKDYLIHILNKWSGNVSAAARESKLDRSNFLRLLRRHGLRSVEYRKIAA
jgi:DNA-binding NtrC family response regulator